MHGSEDEAAAWSQVFDVTAYDVAHLLGCPVALTWTGLRISTPISMRLGMMGRIAPQEMIPRGAARVE